MSRQHVEHWFCFKLPEHFQLSDSKKKATESDFWHFSDYIRPLATKVPEEFDLFFNSLRTKIDRVSKETLLLTLGPIPQER